MLVLLICPWCGCRTGYRGGYAAPSGIAIRWPCRGVAGATTVLYHATGARL